MLEITSKPNVIFVPAAPKDANTLFNLGYILQKQNRHDEAVAIFDAAVAINTSLDRAWFGRGVSLVALARHAEAILAFERAAKLQPMNPHALYELGIQHHHLGQREALDKVIEKLRGFDPKATAQLIAATSAPETTGT
jgi:tetratricopeptide (TPR) repeat protein